MTSDKCCGGDYNREEGKGEEAEGENAGNFELGSQKRPHGEGYYLLHGPLGT